MVAGFEPKIFIDVGQSIEVPGSGKQPWKIKRCVRDLQHQDCRSHADSMSLYFAQMRRVLHLHVRSVSDYAGPSEV